MVFVLEWLDRENQEIYDTILKEGAGCELEGSGFFVDKMGLLYRNHAPSYDKFEYYRGELEGKAGILHYVSLFIEDKIKLPALLTMQCRIMFEHMLDNDMDYDGHGRHLPDNLLAENRLSEGMKSS